jgi:hypothetical protein
MIQVQKNRSCGTSKNPVFYKRDAEKIIERLEERDREYLVIRAEVESITIEKIAAAMFQEDSDYVKRRREKGFIKDDSTLREIQGHLKNFIVKNYGQLKIEELDPVVVDNDLIRMDRSNSWRNRQVSILNFILDEAVWLKMCQAGIHAPLSITAPPRLVMGAVYWLFPCRFSARTGSGQCQGRFLPSFPAYLFCIYPRPPREKSAGICTYSRPGGLPHCRLSIGLFFQK